MTDVDLASTARLIGDPARAAMLDSLMTGTALAAGAMSARRAFAFPCLDFTQRRAHLAGALGASLCRCLLDRGWLVRRRSGERAVRLTDAGRAGLAEAFGTGLPQPLS